MYVATSLQVLSALVHLQICSILRFTCVVNHCKVSLLELWTYPTYLYCKTCRVGLYAEAFYSLILLCSCAICCSAIPTSYVWPFNVF